MPSPAFHRAATIPLCAGLLMTAVVFASPSAQAQSANVVTIKNFMFMPMSLTVKAGATVTWKNLDGEPHLVASDSGLFRSGALDQNDSFRFKFDKPGVYGIFCGIHPNMKETITVQ